ncbi:hypothetical protein EIP91_002424 [Steccherinum ochraceum]|uniref:Alpha-ketoglutarate-dependent dioxygenase AlkB-like domain-containing protein n=1 Tax=Steccherinum ochraceum TaxID=92696 RepID=A0A4R0RKN6_9APHY|nr:hypothetical protein EIP91_002424 [Steccherinum ochraceum]
MLSANLNELQDPSSSAYKKAKRLHQKTTKNRPEHVDADWTPFRAAEKKFKARFPPPDLSEVFDIAARDPSRAHEIRQGGWSGRSDAIPHELHKPVDGSAHPIYTFPQIPGLVLLPSFLSSDEQRGLIRWSLRDHARHPNETNLDIHYIVPEEGPWNLSRRSTQEGSDPVEDIQPRASTCTASPAQAEPSGPRQLIANEPADKSNYLNLASEPKLPAAPSTTLKSASPEALLPKLRWANIGWFYHWGTKHYDFSRGKIPVSDVYKDVCKRAVSSVPWSEVFGDDWREDEWGEDDWTTWNDSYEPDAGIVNFYQTKDTLMAHVDRSEVCATSPLVSVSLGCAAIFLIGGLTRDTEPIPILLRSGDVVIISGPQCRRAYHGKSVYELAMTF